MPLPKSYNETRILPQVYSIVAEVDKYPEFVPWCVGTRKIERFLLDEDREFIESGTTAGQRAVDYIELSVGFRALHDSYVSRVLTDREAESVDSKLFKTMISKWRFEAVYEGDEKCHVNFSIDFEFKSYLYAYFANIFFIEVATQMVSAFENRCIEIYGSRT